MACSSPGAQLVLDASLDVAPATGAAESPPPAGAAAPSAAGVTVPELSGVSGCIMLWGTQLLPLASGEPCWGCRPGRCSAALGPWRAGLAPSSVPCTLPAERSCWLALTGPALPAHCRAGIRGKAVGVLLLGNGTLLVVLKLLLLGNGTLLVVLKLLLLCLCPKMQPKHGVVS